MAINLDSIKKMHRTIDNLICRFRVIEIEILSIGLIIEMESIGKSTFSNEYLSVEISGNHPNDLEFYQIRIADLKHERARLKRLFGSIGGFESRPKRKRQPEKMTWTPTNPPPKK